MGLKLYTILIPCSTILSSLAFLAVKTNDSLSPQRAGKAHVVSGVIHGLLQGRWRGGERLTEEAVAQIFAVSRTPVREGLLELAAMGMVQLRRNCGAVLQPFGPKQLSEIYAVRTLLEVEAARLASDSGIQVNAGHGLNYGNVAPILSLPKLVELNIGHSIVSRAVFVGLEQATREMVTLLQ